MAQAKADWHGTIEEQTALAAAMARNCSCEWDPGSGALTVQCSVHRAVLEDQRFCDGVVYARRLAECLIREEFTP